MTVEQRRLSVLSLFDEAVRRDMRRYHEQGHKQGTARLQWWQALRGQLLAHLTPDAVDLEPRLNAALENLSSMGIWFEAPSLQLPDRTYTALIRSPLSQPGGGERQQRPRHRSRL